MMFVLGVITGLLLSLLVVATLTYFRRVIEHKTVVIEKQIEALGPKPQGFIVMPPSDEEESRDEIIKGNRKAGRDTKISELI